MGVVSSQKSSQAKLDFFAKHRNDYTVETIGNDAEYYRKTYEFADGAVWYEVMIKQFIEETIEVRLVPVNLIIAMLQTECWNSEDSTTIISYEQWQHRHQWVLE